MSWVPDLRRLGLLPFPVSEHGFSLGQLPAQAGGGILTSLSGACGAWPKQQGVVGKGGTSSPSSPSCGLYLLPGCSDLAFGSQQTGKEARAHFSG